MPVHIRPAVVADVPAIFRVRTSVKENHLSLAQLAGRGITPASVSKMISDDACSWVAVSEGQVVGFAMVDLVEGALFAAFVLPSHEACGVGRALVARAEEALFARHAVAWLETARSSRAAGFYRRLGWGQEVDVGDGDIRLAKARG